MSLELETSDARIVRVNVFDREKRPLHGANIIFYLNSVPVGAVASSHGFAAINFPSYLGRLAVEAEYAGLSLRVGVDENDPIVALQLNVTSNLLKSDAPRVARCPDGTAGQPCVECRIGASVIRVCG